MVPDKGALLREDFVNPDDVKAFAHALLSEGDVGHVLPTGDPSSAPPMRISAASDFAPIHEKVKKRPVDEDVKLRSVDRGVPEGFMYSALRWPLLWLVGTFIVIDFLLYVFIRQVVNMIETLVAWHGKSRELRRRMRSATSYPEWKRAALDLDRLRDYESWKGQDASAFYDWRIIQREDTNALMGVLNLCLKNNFAGVENFSLYSQSFYGTKHLIEQYYHELERALHYLEDSALDPKVKRTFYRVASKNFGKTALCLSGGASFAYYHFGVVKALLDANLLPNIVSGTSAGGLVAALVCTRTNEELKALLVPELASRITGCDEPLYVWIMRMYRTGARFDAVRWATKAMFFTRGSLTFREAFERTGKTLNISVVPFDQHSPAQLLNHITAPDCLIWSALIASAAVPGILNPVFLMQKLPDGSLHPWSWGYNLRVDIPLQQLHSLFNVTYPIVSQVNPHVHLFHYGSKGAPGRPTAFRKGKGWRGGFVLSAAEHIVRARANAEILRDLNLLPKMLGQDWSSVFLQPFHGAATIWPKSQFWDWPRLLTDPDAKELSRMLFVGQNVTFPKMHMISNRIHIERAIARGRELVRKETEELGGPSRTLTYASDDTQQYSPAEIEPSEASETEPTVPSIPIPSANGPPRPKRKWRSSSQELRKGLARSQSSVLETYSPEWFRFLHGVDSPATGGTPDDSGAEDGPVSSHSTPKRGIVQRYPVDGSSNGWRRRGSMVADGTLSTMPADDAWADQSISLTDGDETLADTTDDRSAHEPRLAA